MMKNIENLLLLFCLLIFVLCLYTGIKIKNIEKTINEITKDVYVEIECKNIKNEKCIN